MPDGPIVVIKIGGSVLSGARAYRRVARALADRICDRPHERLLAVVSAEAGVTDALLDTAREAAGDPDPDTLDLLWSTGELRSVALLTLALHGRGVRAVAINVAQTGLNQRSRSCRDTTATGEGWDTILDGAAIRPLRLRARLAEADVAVAPGFLARSPGDGVASLGRGGSDLSAVLFAAGLHASACELVKDVSGYFTADPRLVPHASPVSRIDYKTAIAMARDGCELVQLHALEAARDLGVPLCVHDLSGRGTIVR